MRRYFGACEGDGGRRGSRPAGSGPDGGRAAPRAMASLIFDTTFLIDYQRERSRGPGKAHEFLREHATDAAFLPVAAYGEWAEGFTDRTEPAFVSLVQSFELLPVTRPVADVYAQTVRDLRARGQLIGANDLWIAATALEKDWPLVTRNLKEFSRVTGLRCLSY